MSEEKTPYEACREIWINCYPNDLDNGMIVKKVWADYYTKIVIESIIKETLEEYTNDENHDRVVFWKQALFAIKSLK